MAENVSGLRVNVEVDDNVSIPLKQIESSVIRFVGAVTASLAALRVAFYEVQVSSELQKELLNIQKTTGFADTTIKEFSKSLIAMSRQVNVSAVDLAKIAAIGGQLGLGTAGSDALAQFTETAARFSSVLDVAVEDAGNGIAKISNIFQLALTDAERIASAFNELSNNSTASGADLIDVVQRLGDAGGTIDLSESLGLAATGRDLGLSLETIGTSFVKIFSDMQSKAEDFGQFLGISTKDWAELVEKDGVGALKTYLAALRELRSDSRALTIEQLSGGGRIFSLVSKLAADQQNVVLDRNLQSARRGWEDGSSAIREQQTVLGGFLAQVQILKNEFNALAISLGDRVLPALTATVMQFQDWISDPAVQQGITTIANQFMYLAGVLYDLMKAVANLNINWSNLIPLLLILAASKISKMLFDWVNGFGLVKATVDALVNSLYRMTAAGKAAAEEARKAAADAAIAAGAQPAKGFTSRAASFVTDKKDKFYQTIGLGEELAARKAADAAIAALDQARTAESIALRNQQLANAVLASEEEALANAKSARSQIVQDAKVTQLGIVEDTKLRVNRELSDAKRAAAVTLSVRMHAIAEEQKLAISKATTAAEINNANAVFNYKTAKALQESTAEVAAAQSTATQTIALAEKTAAAEIAAVESATLKTALGYAARTKAARDHYNATVAAAAGAAATTEAAETVSQEKQKAKMIGFAGVVGGVLRTLGTLVSKLFGAIFWVTIIASILEMMGLMKPLTDLFFKLAEALGFTSKEQRRLREESALTADQMKADYDKMVAARDEFLQNFQKKGPVRRGELTEATEDNVVENVVTATIDVSQRAGQSVDFAKKTEESNAAVIASAVEGSKAWQQYARDIDTAADAIDALGKRISDLESAKNRKKTVPGVSDIDAEIKKNKLQLAELERDQKAKIALQAEVSRKIRSGAVLDANRQVAAAKQAKDGTIAAQEETSKRVTEVVYNTANTVVRQTAEANDRRMKLIEGDASKRLATETQLQYELRKKGETRLREELDTLKKSGTADPKEIAQAEQRLALVSSMIAKTDAEIAGLQFTMLTVMNAVHDNEAAMIDSLRNLSLKGLTEVLGYWTQVRNTIGLDGSLLLAAKPRAAPTKTANTENSKSNIAKAQFKLRKAELEAELDLVKAFYDEANDINDTYYARGYIAFKEYMDAKYALSQYMLDKEIELKKLEVAEAEKQLAASEAFDKKNKKGTTTKTIGLKEEVVEAKGELDVLQAERLANDRKFATEREIGEEQANDLVLEAQAQFLEAYGSAAEAARIREEISSRERVRRAEAEVAAAQAALGTAAPGQEFAIAFKRVNDAELDLKTIRVNLQSATFKVNVEEAKQRIEDALALGTITPEVALGQFNDLADSVPKGLAAGIDLIWEQISTADEDELPGLIARLNAAEQAVLQFSDSIRDGMSSAVNEFSSNITTGLQLGLVAPDEATAQITQFAETLRTKLNRQMEELQIKIAAATEGDAGLPDMQTRLAKLRIEAAQLQSTLQDLSRVILDTFNADIDMQVAIGQLSQVEAGELKVAAARKQSAEFLKRNTEEMKRLTDAVNNGIATPEQLARLSYLNRTYQELANTISDLANTINGQVRQAFVDFFKTTADGTTRMSDAWTKFKQDIRSTIAETLATDLVDKTLGPLLSGAGSLGDLVSKALTPGGSKRGESRTNPLFVQDVSATKANASPTSQVGGIFTGLGDWLKNLFTGSGDGGSGSSGGSFFDTVTDFAGTIASSLGGALSGVGGIAAKLFGGGTKAVWGAGKGNVDPSERIGATPDNPLYTSVVELPEGTGQGGGAEAGAPAGGEGEDGVDAAIDGVGEQAKSWWDSIVDGFSKGWESLTSVFSKGWESFTGMLSSGWQSISGLFGGLGGAIAGIFHTGGIAGYETVSRVVSPMTFAKAHSYHTGGLPGLAPDEVPAILQKGEEVLTARDPRHRKNGGLAGAMGGAQNGSLNVMLSDSALNVTMRDWLERELAHLAATR